MAGNWGEAFWNSYNTGQQIRARKMAIEEEKYDKIANEGQPLFFRDDGTPRPDEDFADPKLQEQFKHYVNENLSDVLDENGHPGTQIAGFSQNEDGTWQANLAVKKGLLQNITEILPWTQNRGSAKDGDPPVAFKLSELRPALEGYMRRQSDRFAEWDRTGRERRAKIADTATLLGDSPESMWQQPPTEALDDASTVAPPPSAPPPSAPPPSAPPPSAPPSVEQEPPPVDDGLMPGVTGTIEALSAERDKIMAAADLPFADKVLGMPPEQAAERMARLDEAISRKQSVLQGATGDEWMKRDAPPQAYADADMTGKRLENLQKLGEIVGLKKNHSFRQTGLMPNETYQVTNPQGQAILKAGGWDSPAQLAQAISTTRDIQGRQRSATPVDAMVPKTISGGKMPSSETIAKDQAAESAARGTVDASPEQTPSKYEGLNDAMSSALRASGAPPITSGYRDPDKNRAVGGADKSQHLHGNAADIDMSGMNDEQRVQLMERLYANGVTRFGTYTNSPNMLHVDMSPNNGDFWLMHDRSNKNINKAPAYLHEFASRVQGGSAEGLAAAGGQRQAVDARMAGGSVSSMPPIAPRGLPYTPTRDVREAIARRQALYPGEMSLESAERRYTTGRIAPPEISTLGGTKRAIDPYNGQTLWENTIPPGPMTQKQAYETQTAQVNLQKAQVELETKLAELEGQPLKQKQARLKFLEDQNKAYLDAVDAQQPLNEDGSRIEVDGRKFRKIMDTAGFLGVLDQGPTPASISLLTRALEITEKFENFNNNEKWFTPDVRLHTAAVGALSMRAGVGDDPENIYNTIMVPTLSVLGKDVDNIPERELINTAEMVGLAVRMAATPANAADVVRVAREYNRTPGEYLEDLNNLRTGVDGRGVGLSGANYKTYLERLNAARQGLGATR